MYRLATKCTTKNVSKKHVHISLYRLLTVEPCDLILSSLVMLHARACKSHEVSWPTYVPSWVSGFVSVFHFCHPPDCHPRWSAPSFPLPCYVMPLGPLHKFVLNLEYVGERWKTVAEVSAPETTASVSLYSLNTESQYTFRVFAVNARGLGHPSPVSGSLLVSGNCSAVFIICVFVYSPTFTTNFSRCFFSFSTPAIWYELPTAIRGSNVFKCRLEMHLTCLTTRSAARLATAHASDLIKQSIIVCDTKRFYCVVLYCIVCLFDWK